MKLCILLFLASLLTSVYAFSDVGAYERLWYWYAYTLDSAGNKVAPLCRGTAPNKRCTFQEFMKYIDEHPKNMLPLKKVDPLNVPRAVDELIAGRYTGTYQTQLIYRDIKKQNAVADLMKAITGFVTGNMDGADDQTKAALQQVTKAVAAMRLTAALPSLTKFLGDLGITVVTSPFPPVPGSTETVDYIDIQQTAHTNGVEQDVLIEHVKTWQGKEIGHMNNIRASRAGAAAVAAACVAGPS